MPFIYGILCGMICKIDIQEREIPDEIILGGIIYALAYNGICREGMGFFPAMSSMILGFILMVIAGCLGYVVARTAGMGGGDVKLMAMIGAFWGTETVLITFAIAPLMMSIYAAVFEKEKTPYGVFMVAASLIGIYFSGRIS